jgi:hypothetical protein
MSDRDSPYGKAWGHKKDATRQGNWQPATGNRQPATGNCIQIVLNYVIQQQKWQQIMAFPQLSQLATSGNPFNSGNHWQLATGKQANPRFDIGIHITQHYIIPSLPNYLTNMSYDGSMPAWIMQHVSSPLIYVSPSFACESYAGHFPPCPSTLV